MDSQKTYTLDDLYGLLSNLENPIPDSRDKTMRRVKLPIPKEYGGGWATGETVEEAVKRLLDRVRTNITVTVNSPLFGPYADQWLAIKEGEERSPSTTECYRNILETHLKPFFQGKRLADITPDDIQLYYNSIFHLSKSYANQSKAILTAIFDRAARHDLITKNPMQYKYEHSKKQGEKVVLQDADLISVIGDLEKLKSSSDQRDYLYACFLCFSALRRSEILGLRWKDINFDSQELIVRNSVSFPNGTNNPVVGVPKADSKGIVHLQSGLAERILPYRSKPDSYVIPYANEQPNKPVTRSMFTKMWYRIRKTIDLKGATSHSFRASYASMMNAHCEHIDPKALQGALRHRTPDLAIKVYTKQNKNKTRSAEIEYDEYLCRTISHAAEQRGKAQIP